jgi:hypothetical protein
MNFRDNFGDNIYDAHDRRGRKKRRGGGENGPGVTVPGTPTVKVPGAGQQARSGYRGSANEAWLQEVLAKMASSRQLAMSETPMTEIVVTNAAATFHAYSSLKELMTACYAAVQGESRKSFASGALSASLFNMTAGTAAAGIKTFGWRLRFTASQLNFAFRPISVNIGPILNTAGVLSIPSPVLSFQFISRRMPVDIIVISPANAAGLATITQGSQDDVVLTTTTSANNGVQVVSLADANTFATIETLNARDLIARPTQLLGNSSSDAVYDDDERYGSGGSQPFGGIRDGIRDDDGVYDNFG